MENLTVKDGIDINSNTYNAYYSPGDIIMLNSSTTPTGFLACDGSTITQSEYPALYATLGTYYDPAGSVCKLPNLNQNFWIFPCCTVGNEVAYPSVSASHTHPTKTTSITSGSTDVPEHNHSFSTNTPNNDTDSYHQHNAIGSGPPVNNASNVANRSNGSGQGTNLAIAGHTHSWGANSNADAGYDSHSHAWSGNVLSPALGHTHNTNISTNSGSEEYILNNVISMKYYIKY